MDAIIDDGGRARVCFVEGTTDNHQNGASLDVRRKEKEGKIENNREKNS